MFSTCLDSRQCAPRGGRKTRQFPTCGAIARAWGHREGKWFYFNFWLKFLAKNWKLFASFCILARDFGLQVQQDACRQTVRRAFSTKKFKLTNHPKMFTNLPNVFKIFLKILQSSFSNRRARSARREKKNFAQIFKKILKTLTTFCAPKNVWVLTIVCFLRANNCVLFACWQWISSTFDTKMSARQT